MRGLWRGRGRMLILGKHDVPRLCPMPSLPVPAANQKLKSMRQKVPLHSHITQHYRQQPINYSGQRRMLSVLQFGFSKLLSVDQRALIRNLSLTFMHVRKAPCTASILTLTGLCLRWRRAQLISLSVQFGCLCSSTGGPTGEENGSSVEVQLHKERPDKGVCTGCVLQQRA